MRAASQRSCDTSRFDDQPCDGDAGLDLVFTAADGEERERRSACERHGRAEVHRWRLMPHDGWAVALVPAGTRP